MTQSNKQSEKTTKQTTKQTTDTQTSSKAEVEWFIREGWYVSDEQRTAVGVKPNSMWDKFCVWFCGKCDAFNHEYNAEV